MARSLDVADGPALLEAMVGWLDPANGLGERAILCRSQAHSAGHRVLVLEKGRHWPARRQQARHPAGVQGRGGNREPWRDGRGGHLVPDEHCNVGGKTKWYGAALLRFSAHEFAADRGHQCLAWPFGRAELEPYYDEAERLMHVNRFDNEPELQLLIDRIACASATT